MAGRSVSSLNQVQDVQFVKHLLARIDPSYFRTYESVKNNDSYQEVLDRLNRYFKDEIGTDVSEAVEGRNRTI